MNIKETGGCLSDETLCGYADGTLREGRERLEAHLAECDRCLAALSELIAFDRSLDGANLDSPPLALERRVQTQPGASAVKRGILDKLSGFFFSYRMAGAVATVSVAVLLAVWIGQWDRPSTPSSQTREIPTSGSEGIRLVGPRGTLHAPDTVRFRWDPRPGGTQYVLTVVDADSGRVVVREAVQPPEHTVQATHLRRAGGRNFEWMIECTLEDGRVALSPAVPFRIVDALPEE